MKILKVTVGGRKEKCLCALGQLNRQVLTFDIFAALLPTGADPARVQRVHLHPLRFGNGCNAPVLKKTESSKIGRFIVAHFH